MTDRMPASECASWCRSGDSGDHDRADHHCESPPRTVTLSMHPMLLGDVEAPVPNHLAGSLQQNADASVPHIVVRHRDVRIDLSIDDARRLAAELLTLAEAATT